MTEGATTGRCWPGVVRSQYRGQRGASGPDHPSEAVSRRLGKRLVVNVGDKSIAASLMPVQPGPETEALRRFLVDCTWAGDVEAGGMGPGSPAMTAIGRATVEWISDGIWAVSDLEQQQFVGGKEVLTWKAHLIAGWDFSAREYRASVADSNGNLGLYVGQIEGDRLTLTSMSEYMIWGQPTRLRFTWDVHGPGLMKWRNETSVKGGPWTLVEEYTMTPTNRQPEGPRIPRSRDG